MDGLGGIRRRTEGTDPERVRVLRLIDLDIAAHTERLQSIDVACLQRIQALVGDASVDLGVSLSADGE